LDANDIFQRVRSIRIFKHCSDEFIRSLVAISRLEQRPEGINLITQDAVNRDLHVLLSGRVEVLVDGERVAVLENSGDLIGEISVLSERGASATVVARSPVQCLAIGFNDLERVVTTSRGEFGYDFYRSLFLELSEKMTRTNDKARRFEMANRALTSAMSSLEEANRTLDQKVKERTQDLENRSLELKKANSQLESRNSELVASHRKLEELYSTKTMTFKRLNELQSQFLTPLLDTLTELEKSAGPGEKSRLERAKAQVVGSVEMLRPMSEVYSTEQAIRNRRVLLAEDDRKQQVVTKMALGGSGVNLSIASTIEEARQMLKGDVGFDLAFVSSGMADLIPEVRQHQPAAKLVFMASSNVPAELPRMKQYASLFTNIVSRHPEDRTFTVKSVATTVSKLISKDLFGLEKYMIWGVEVQSRPVTRSQDRADLIAEMESHLKKVGVRSTITERAATVAEELLMNAIYDAPQREGKHLYNHLPRTEHVELQKGEQGEFRYACDGMLAAISVSDPFGGFPMTTLLGYLERNYMGQADPQAHGKGGAGRGLHQIVENSDLVVFNVQRNLRTEVIALFNLDMKAVVEGAKPSFQFFLE
jgi:CRP-like cAMP-binding protein